MGRAATAYLTWGDRYAASYLRGSVAEGEFVPGLSDVDTVVVFPDDSSGPGSAGERARQRWRRLSRALPLIELVVDRPGIYDEVAIRSLVGTSALTYGLGESAGSKHPRAAYFGAHATFDWLRMLERPGLYGAGEDWRLVSGPDRRPPGRVRDAQADRIAAWLELVYWWRRVFPVCIDPTGPRTAMLCVELVAACTRIWLWLAHGERTSGRVESLNAGLRLIPDEEPWLRRTLALSQSLAESPPPPLRELLPGLVRISSRIGVRLTAEAGAEGTTGVRLTGAEPAELIFGGGQWQPMGSDKEGRQPQLLPLADWRSLACPLLADESFAPLPGDPGDPAVLGAAAASQQTGPYPALRADGLMFLPAGPWWRTRLRAVHCRATDPVSFALSDGDRVARFPKLRGWSAEDTARRAVAEHRAWLLGEPGPWAGSGSPGDPGQALAMLLTATRAALFLGSVNENDPELALTVTETARHLSDRSPAARTVAEQALEGYRDFADHGRQPSAKTISAMRKAVLDLPAYAQDNLQA